MFTAAITLLQNINVNIAATANQPMIFTFYRICKHIKNKTYISTLSNLKIQLDDSFTKEGTHLNFLQHTIKMKSNVEHIPVRCLKVPNEQ